MKLYAIMDTILQFHSPSECAFVGYYVGDDAKHAIRCMSYDLVEHMTLKDLYQAFNAVLVEDFDDHNSTADETGIDNETYEYLEGLANLCQ